MREEGQRRRNNKKGTHKRTAHINERQREAEKQETNDALDHHTIRKNDFLK